MTNVTHSRLVRMSIKKVDGPQDQITPEFLRTFGFRP